MQDDCSCCVKEGRRGGICEGKYDGKPCFSYECDPRGYIDTMDAVYNLSFDHDLSDINDWHKIEVRGIKKTIKVINISSLEWDKNNQGLRGIKAYCRINYFTEENGPWPKGKPKLRVVKQGEGTR